MRSCYFVATCQVEVGVKTDVWPLAVVAWDVLAKTQSALWTSNPCELGIKDEAKLLDVLLRAVHGRMLKHGINRQRALVEAMRSCLTTVKDRRSTSSLAQQFENNWSVEMS